MQTHKDVTDINLQLKARPHRAITALLLSQRVLGVEGEMKYQIRPFGQQRRSAWISGFFIYSLYKKYIFKVQRKKEKISLCMCQWCLCSWPRGSLSRRHGVKGQPMLAHTYACSVSVWYSECSFCPAAKTVHPFKPPLKPALQEGNGEIHRRAD